MRVMALKPEMSRARWHSRGGFVFTTLLVLLAVGAPFMVTRGLIAHGALFLPAVLALMLLLGGPLVRVGLATGQLASRLHGREALHSVQLLVRLTLALVLLFVAVKAAGWIFAETAFGVPVHALDFRGRELTSASTSWHTAVSPALWSGAGAVLLTGGILAGMAWRRRLAGLSWISGWLLSAIVLLLLLGLVVGVSLPGAGALAALAAPLRWEAPLKLAFWGDAGAIAVLALGGQAALIAAAGRGLPKRAPIGPEARTIVAGISFLTVLVGLVGLLLLSALCLRQGIMPRVEHAAPDVLALELVPALGRQLFPAWPDVVQPTERQLTLAWSFLVALVCSVGAAALLVARPIAPSPLLSRSAWFGYAAGIVAVAAVAAGLAAGLRDGWLPLIVVMPALLAILHLTLARRAGTDLRIAASAFESSKPWLRTLNTLMAFRVARVVLLLLLVAIAASSPRHGVVLGGFALAFALMWVGSLRPRPRSGKTGLLRAATAATLLMVSTGVVLADDAYRDARASADSGARRQGIARFELHWMRGGRADPETMQQDAATLLAASRDVERPADERARAVAQARVVLACLLIVDPVSDESLRLERAMLAHDGFFPYSRLDEAASDHARGNSHRLVALLRQIDEHLAGAELGAALDADAEMPNLLAALVSDMRDTYGAGGREAQRLRIHLLQRATAGRTLLKPNPGAGAVYIGCLLLAAFALAAALVLSVGRARAPTQGREDRSAR